MLKKPSTLPGQMKTCAACGKEYLRTTGNIYKLVYKGKTYHCCCYTCYMKLTKLKETRQHEALMQLVSAMCPA